MSGTQSRANVEKTPSPGCKLFLPQAVASDGFTLLELMCIVAIIATLTGLLLPAIDRSKARAQALTCLNYKKQMSYAWIMYSGENNDRLAYNLTLGGQPTLMSIPQTPNPNWVTNIMDWELTTANTNLEFVNQSILAPYLNFSASMFHCPSDQSLSAVQKGAGWNSRVRSISMNALVGNPGNLVSGGNNPLFPGYQQFVKESDFRDASRIFVFLDEHPDSINNKLANFTISTAGQQWVDLPGSYHNGGGSFCFADGHAEIHHWLDSTTARPPLPDASKLPTPLSSTNRTDFDWIIGHAALVSQP